MMVRRMEVIKRILVLLVVLLFVNLPFVTALQFSNIRAVEVTEESATVMWDTDEAADSFLSYGESKEDLQTVGDANAVLKHALRLNGLSSETEYFYKVESSGEDNSSSLFSFTTSAPDETPPGLEVEVPERVAGNKVEISGKTEVGISVKIYVDGVAVGSMAAVPVGMAGMAETEALAGNAIYGLAGEGGIQKAQLEGRFVFKNVLLKENQPNAIKVEASDKAGNKAFWEGTTFADTSKPRLTLEKLPGIVEKKSVTLKGTITEKAAFEIFVNNKSTAKGEGANIEQKISLEEGKNKIEIVLIDGAGWRTIEETEIISDTRAPFVKAKIERGTEYFDSPSVTSPIEGRAASDIHGETEPGAVAYLYVYRPASYEFKPDFKKARARVVANEKGEFTFEKVNFAASITDLTIDDLAPKEVPPELLDLTIFPVEAVVGQQQFTYSVYIIVEDRTGKSAYWQQKVNVKTCYSNNLDFSVGAPRFQMPMKLVPDMLDQGRQEISAVFELDYLGGGLPGIDEQGEEFDKGYKVTRIRFDKACTQSMINSGDDAVSLGCKLLPSSSKVIQNNDGTSVFTTWNLMASKTISQSKSSYWDKFKNSRVVFPLKIQIQYQERTGKDEQDNDLWSESKTQTSCVDLGYFIDIPIDSSDLMPDFLADSGVKALNETINAMGWLRPKVETAFFASAVTCMGFAALRFIARGVRVITSKYEFFRTVFKFSRGDKSKQEEMEKEKERCPYDQNPLFLEDNLNKLLKLPDEERPKALRGVYEGSLQAELHNLEIRCSATAKAWKAEAALHQAFRWSCDRAGCRAVPAKWTEKVTNLNEIDQAILKQRSCSVTGKGIPLEKVENCQKLVDANPTHMPVYLKRDDVVTCWRTADGNLYIYYQDNPKIDKNLEKKGVYLLTRVGNIGGDLGPRPPNLLVMQPEDSEGYIVGRNEKCEDVCGDPKRPGYSAKEPKCAEENKDGTFTPGLDRHKGLTDFAAGYTEDCFVDASGELEQCICTPTQEEKDKEKIGDVHVAGAGEEWFYRQERLYKESTLKNKGTYYPKQRYYGDRDRSASFGLDHVLDYITFPFTGKKEIPELNPHSQWVAPWQMLCLPAMLKHIKIIESTAIWLKTCILQAKHSSLHDVGMCKAIFARQACGMMYKVIAYLTSGCSGISFDDWKKEGEFEDVGFLVSEGTDAFAGALDSSVDDMMDDYGQATFGEFFREGTAGFAQSICLAAFGIEVPMFSKDFLIDSAYAFPMKSLVTIAPRFRTLSSYNPAQQTAIFDYEVGGAVIPGCKVRQWKLSLKCVGPEDVGKEGVDCSGVECDCLNFESTGSSTESDREKILKSGFDLPNAEVFDIPLPPRTKIDSHYRYDHVKLELTVDSSLRDEMDKCFDEEYIEGLKGVYYFPIKDTSPPVQFNCRAMVPSGRYSCPEFADMFGFGGNYMESPYVTCRNKNTGKWVSCTTPNIFLLNDEIRTRVHLNLDGKGLCVKRTINNIPGIEETLWYQIPEGINGLYMREDSLANVKADMFGGISSSKLQPLRSNNPGCRRGITTLPGSGYNTVRNSAVYRFNYDVVGGKVRLKMPNVVTIEDSDYFSDSDGYLEERDSGKTEFTVDEINEIPFSFGGMKVKNILSDTELDQSPNMCGYQVLAGGSVTKASNVRNFQARYELYKKPEAGCKFATERLMKPAFGKVIHPANIRIQQQETGIEELDDLHQLFMNGQYSVVRGITLNIMQQKKADLHNAIGIYYYLASLIMEGDGLTAANRNQVENLLTTFFKRKWVGEDMEIYGPSVQTEPVFRKIKKYFCVIDDRMSREFSGRGTLFVGECGVVSGGGSPSAPATLGATTSATTAPSGTATPASTASATGGGTCAGYGIDVGDGYKHKCLSTTRAKGCDPRTGNPTNEYNIADVGHATRRAKLEAECNSGSAVATTGGAGSTSAGVCVGYDIDVGDGYKHKCLSTTRAKGCDPRTGNPTNEYNIADVGHATRRGKLEVECNR